MSIYFYVFVHRQTRPFISPTCEIFLPKHQAADHRKQKVNRAATSGRADQSRRGSAPERAERQSAMGRADSLSGAERMVGEGGADWGRAMTSRDRRRGLGPARMSRDRRRRRATTVGDDGPRGGAATTGRNRAEMAPRRQRMGPRPRWRTRSRADSRRAGTRPRWRTRVGPRSGLGLN